MLYGIRMINEHHDPVIENVIVDKVFAVTACQPTSFSEHHKLYYSAAVKDMTGHVELHISAPICPGVDEGCTDGRCDNGEVLSFGSRRAALEALLVETEKYVARTDVGVHKDELIDPSSTWLTRRKLMSPYGFMQD